jgi:hypothetical protein
MMMTTSRIFPLLLAWFLPQAAHSSAFFSPTVECVSITGGDVDDSTTTSTFEVCGIYDGFGPSPAQFPDGTIVYIGGYGTTFTILQGLEEGTDTSIDGFAAADTGIEIYVYRNDNGACNVTVTIADVPENCSTCNYCGNETYYSADCTNVENGRNVVECESTTSIFFPLTAAALPGQEVQDVETSDGTSRTFNQTNTTSSAFSNKSDSRIAWFLKGYVLVALLMIC